MARQKPKVDPRDIVPPTGELQLPDVASFDTDKPQPSAPKGNRQPGRVVGLDYTAWATAIIDLADKPDRITDARQRYAAKGYKAIGGDPLVIGVAEPEVWVIPRAMYERNRANRAARIREAVQDKRMSPTAIMRGTVTQGGEQTFS
jgi:hypothetical protein